MSGRWFLRRIWWLAACCVMAAPTAVDALCAHLGANHVPVRMERVGPPLTDYFAFIEFDTATPIGLGQLRPDGQDLRVTDIACTELDYWIEAGLNTAATRLWVKVPSVPTGLSGIYLHYGNLALTHVNQPANVFGASIGSLHTFSERGGTTVADAQGGHDLELQGGAAWTTGPRPGLGAVTGIDSGRLVAADAGVALGRGSFTVFSVINVVNPNGSTQGIIGSYPNDASNGWVLKVQGGPGQFMLLTNELGGWCQVSGGAVPAGEWTSVGGRRVAGSENALFQDGANLGPICAGDARDLDGPGRFELGRAYTGNYPLTGSISFSIVYTAALSDTEIAALQASLLPATHPQLQVGTPFADLMIGSPDHAAFTVGSPGAWPIVVTGDPPPVVTVTGALPAGVTFDQPSQSLVGTPQLGSAGVYPLSVLASNGGIAADATQSLTLTVNRTGQTIAFPNPGSQIDGGVVALAATATSTLPVAFSSSTPEVCSVAAASVTLLKAGTCTVVASQPGDAGSYLPAADVEQSFAVRQLGPDAPTDVRASVADAQVTLEWTPAQTGEPADYYVVEVGDAPGRTTVLTRLTAETHETGLLPRGEYFLRVRAINARGMSAPSDDVWVRVATTGAAPAPPLGFTASVAGNDVSLSWRPAAFGAPPDLYLVEIGSRRTAHDLGQLVFPASTTAVTIPGVPPGVYALRLRAKNAFGYTPQTADVLVRVGEAPPCAAAPSRPILLTPVVTGQTVGATWIEAPGDAPTFELQAGSAPGASDVLIAGLGVQTSFAASAGAGQYVVRIVPQSPCGPGAASNEVPLSIGGATPAAPTDVTATPGPGSVTFTWTAPAGPAATHYLLEAGMGDGAPIVKIPVTGATTLTVPGVPPGQYRVRVRSVNASGIGGASAVITVNVP